MADEEEVVVDKVVDEVVVDEVEVEAEDEVVVDEVEVETVEAIQRFLEMTSPVQVRNLRFLELHHYNPALIAV